MGRTHSLKADADQAGVADMAEQPTAEQTQEQLLLRVAAGDAQALADFYDSTAKPLFALAVRILGDISEAEETIQDVFVQIWKHAPSFDPLIGPAFHWALSITRHRAIDRLRARQRRARVLESAQAEAIEEAPTEPDGLASEDGAQVRASLSSLPPDQRHVIELAFFSGLTHQEIANALNEPLGTIKARIRRGLLKLRDNLHVEA